MLKTNRKSSLWTGGIMILSLLLFFFAVPHTLEDFAVGEPIEKGVPVSVLSFVVAALFALQGLALFWAGQEDRRSYFIHAGLGLLWPLAAGVAQLPVIFTASNYRSGFISILYVVGMIVTGALLFLVSLQALKTGAQAKQEAVPKVPRGSEGKGT